MLTRLHTFLTTSYYHMCCSTDYIAFGLVGLVFKAIPQILVTVSWAVWLVNYPTVLNSFLVLNLVLGLVLDLDVLIGIAPINSE